MPSPFGTKTTKRPGQRDLGRQPGALRLHRVLDRLDEDLLAAVDQVLDPPVVALALELGPDDLVDVEEAVLLEADLDERGLHAGQHVVDRALVDVAGDRALLGPLEVDLGDALVLEHGDALLADVDRDQELALGGRESGGRLAGARRRVDANAAAACARARAWPGVPRSWLGASPASGPRRRPRAAWRAPGRRGLPRRRRCFCLAGSPPSLGGLSELPVQSVRERQPRWAPVGRRAVVGAETNGAKESSFCVARACSCRTRPAEWARAALVECCRNQRHDFPVQG